MERTIHNMRYVLLEPLGQVTDWNVLIYINGNYWDYRHFDTESEAQAFFNDPLKQDREASQRKAARERERMDNDTRWLDFHFIAGIYPRAS